MNLWFTKNMKRKNNYSGNCPFDVILTEVGNVTSNVTVLRVITNNVSNFDRVITLPYDNGFNDLESITFRSIFSTVLKRFVITKNVT
jgi:hypothetical protein